MKQIILPVSVVVLSIVGSIPSFAQTIAPVQSPARPLGLEVVGPVYVGGSDAASASFLKNEYPVLKNFIDQNLTESAVLSQMPGTAFDPTAMKFTTQASARVYFLGEGAGYHNSLGFVAAPGSSFNSSDIPSAQLIFPDASSYVSSYSDGTGMTARTERAPLVPGDFVDLGLFTPGQSLNLLLIANGANYPQNVFTAEAKLNPDGLSHLVSFAIPDSPFVMLGFEDIYGGGDRDYNDLVIAVDIGSENVAQLANPEPATWMMMILFGGALVWVLRRRPIAPQTDS